MAISWALTLKNILLPIYCRECRCPLLTEDNGYFCPSCWAAPTRVQRPYCTVCCQPQVARLGFGDVENFPCDECRTARPRAYRRIYAAADYDGPVADAVKLLKFHDRRKIANPIAELMIDFALREIDLDRYTDIVPVPLHRVRERSRGFNQSRLLAERLKPIFPNAELNTSLTRIRPTRTQSTLNSPKERKENVRGAFAVDQETDLGGRHILLIDDVVTSGGTANECAKALKRAGAESVDVFAGAIPFKLAGPGLPAVAVSDYAQLPPRTTATRENHHGA